MVDAFLKQLWDYSLYEWDAADEDQHKRLANRWQTKSTAEAHKTFIDRLQVKEIGIPNDEWRTMILNVLLVAHDHRPAYCVDSNLVYQPTRTLNAVTSVFADVFPQVKMYVGDRGIMFFYNASNRLANVDDMKRINTVPTPMASAEYIRTFGQLLGYVDPTLPQDGPFVTWYHTNRRAKTRLFVERLPRNYDRAVIRARAENIQTILSYYEFSLVDVDAFYEITDPHTTNDCNNCKT